MRYIFPCAFVRFYWSFRLHFARNIYVCIIRTFSNCVPVCVFVTVYISLLCILNLGFVVIVLLVCGKLDTLYIQTQATTYAVDCSQKCARNDVIAYIYQWFIYC